MNIVLLQCAKGDIVHGPIVRVPFGNYKIEKTGKFDSCTMLVNDSKEFLDVNSKIILSNNASIKVIAKGADNLGVRFIREK